MKKLKNEITRDFIWLQLVVQVTLLCFFQDYRFNLGFLAGGFLSFINFHFMAKGLEGLAPEEKNTGFRIGLSSFMFRYVFLIAAVFALAALPNVVKLHTFLPALFSLQLILGFRELRNSFSRRNCIRESA